jgi:hypothetical protein
MLLIIDFVVEFFSNLLSCSLSRTQTRNLVSGFTERKQLRQSGSDDDASGCVTRIVTRTVTP